MTRIPPVLLTLCLMFAGRAQGQVRDTAAHAHAAKQPSLMIGASFIALLTRINPAFGGSDATESYLTQPMIMIHATGFSGRLQLTWELNFERWSLRRGELNPGISGEGYVDRRHPHTFLHEAVLTYTDSAGQAAVSLSAGKGFVAFGTDDPMVRPFVKYPANHHLAQILERAIVTAVTRWRSFMLEATLFNGDEPVNAASLPKWSRFGDSWGLRGTFLPRQELELSASYASIHSPENRDGGGLDHRKSSIAAKWEQPVLSVLAEWARTDEYDGEYGAFSFSTALVEISAHHSYWTVAIRGERTTRPEEERSLDPFRTPVPHGDDNIIGATRWLGATARIARDMESRRHSVMQYFIEIQRSTPEALYQPTFFVPRDFYGAHHIWTFSAGVRLAVGKSHARTGRYGIGNTMESN